MAKLDRLLNLTAALIETDVAFSAEEIREKVPGYPESETAFHRSFERDKDDLRELGIPIETVMLGHLDPPRAGYTIDRRRYELPDPGLSAEELTTLHLAAAAVQLDGIDGTLPGEAIRKLGGSEAPSVAAPLGALPAPPALLSAFGAVLERRELEFGYGGDRRRLQPHRLEFQRGRWYVSGLDLDRGARRTFRLDRFEDPVTTGVEQAFVPPEQTDGVLLRPWEMGEGEGRTASVRLDAAIAPSVLADHPGLDVIADAEPDGSIVVELLVRDELGLRGFLVGLLDRGELLEPADLRAGYVAWLEGFVR